MRPSPLTVDEYAILEEAEEDEDDLKAHAEEQKVPVENSQAHELCATSRALLGEIDHDAEENDRRLLEGIESGTFPLTTSLRLNDSFMATTEGFTSSVTYTERYADDSVYVGTFGAEGREGDGRLCYANGDLYEGQFSGDARHLHGHLAYANGDIYEGEFCKDELEGHGVFQCRDGWRYEGEFHESMIDGCGLLAFANTDFPSQLLGTEVLCGPSRPAVGAAKVPGSLKEILDITRSWGRYRGTFRRGVRHGHGRMEFEISGGSEGGSRSSTAPPPVAPTLEPHFIEAEWAHGQRHGRGTVHVEGHLRYEGEFREDEAEGQGKLVRWFRGGERDTFEGTFRRGAVHGFAKYSGPDGTVYQGHFVDGLRHGDGQLNVRGTGYTGEFRAGLRHGVGRYRSPKVHYSGHYLEDQRHGAGLLREMGTSGEECVYEGEFVASMRQGHGKFKNSECNYDGEWQANVRHGKGRQTWQGSSDSYVGQWQDDKMHGEGTLVTATIRYVGQFTRGEQDGQGVQIWWKNGGDTYEGRFHRSQPHGYGVYKFASRNESYIGNLEHGSMGGEGTYTYSDGSVYEGQWVGGKQHGIGQLTYKDGTVYEGQFEGNTFHGAGAFVDLNGCAYVGNFDHNLRSGEIVVAHADGRRELRRYDSEGQEVERKLTAIQSTFLKSTKQSDRVPEPWLPELLASPRPREKFALDFSATPGRGVTRGLLPAVPGASGGGRAGLA